MKTLKSVAISLAVLALISPLALHSQTVEIRRKTLNTIFTEIWEDRLRTSPEFASSIGDNRYNDQLSDYSVKAYNDQLARGRAYLTRLSEVDTTGLSDQEKLSAALMIRQLVNEQDEARFKTWQMPVNQFNGLHTDLPQLAQMLSFKTVKDYDDWIVRLHKMPIALQQITDNMAAGVNEKRMPPKYLMEKVLAQVNAIAAVKPGDGPFAAPTKKYPSAIPAKEQERITQATLDAVEKDVLPAYARFARFLEKDYVPHGRTDPGAWALPDGHAYYAFEVRQSTTTNLTPDQIHKIGLAEVKRDEDEMLAIALKLGFKDLKAMQARSPRIPSFIPLRRRLSSPPIGMPRLDEAQAAPAIGRLPKAPLIVEAMPSYVEKDQAAAFYQHGTPDGSRPGKVRQHLQRHHTLARKC